MTKVQNCEVLACQLRQNGECGLVFTDINEYGMCKYLVLPNIIPKKNSIIDRIARILNYIDYLEKRKP